MALLLASIAAFLAAMNNLCMRKGIDKGGTSKGFLVTATSFAFLVSIFLGPIKTGHFTWNHTMAFLGLATGLILGVMFWSLGKALEKGPAGLTIAYLNASNLVPAIIMVLLFGVGFGYQYGPWNAIGSLFVLIGLFWAVWQTSKVIKSESFWLTFSTIAFLTHVLFLVLIQWRSLLIKTDLPSSFFIPFTIDASHTEWFTPMLFLGAALFLLYRFKKEETRSIDPIEIRFGCLGGFCSALSTISVVKAAHIAKMWESAVVFPIYAVGIVLICNIWGRLLYQEKVHWKAMSLCLAGLFVGTIDWSQFF